MAIPYFPHSGRRTHYWRIRNERYRELAMAKGWGMRGAYAEKTIRGRAIMQTIVEKTPGYMRCCFQLKDHFWANITAQARAREAEQRRKKLKLVNAESAPYFDDNILFLDINALRARGWTEAVIRRHLGDADRWVSVDHWRNFYGKRLWFIVRVVEAELSGEFSKDFRTSVKRRKSGRRKVAKFKEKRTVQNREICLAADRAIEKKQNMWIGSEQKSKLVELCRECSVSGDAG